MSLIGGDIAGLHAMAAAMTPAGQDMKGVVTALDSGVEGLVHDAGWSGAAADQFRKRWTSDSVSAGALASTVSSVGETLETLATALGELETKLQSAVSTAKAAGVPVRADGSVAPFVVTAPADGSVAPAVAAAKTYHEVSALLVQEARTVRLSTESDLSGLLDELDQTPPSKPDLYVTAADYLRGLLAVPNARAHDLVANYDVRRAALTQARKDARVQLNAAQDAARLAGEKLPRTDPANLAFRRTIEDIKSIDRDVSAARAGRGIPVLSKALDVRLNSIPGIGAAADAAKLPKFLEFAKDIPVIDIAATGLVAGLQSKDDIEKGWSPGRAITTDVGAGVLGLAAGVGVTAYAAAAPVTVPATLVAAGAGVVVVGVGDFAYQAFHEHWSEDIHKDGVVMGTLDGIGHSGARVGQDVAHVAEGGWHAAKSAWHSLFG